MIARFSGAATAITLDKLGPAVGLETEFLESRAVDAAVDPEKLGFYSYLCKASNSE